MECICATTPLVFPPERMSQTMGDKMLTALLELRIPGLQTLLTRIFELGMETQRHLDDSRHKAAAA